jgi:hypothetical protein
VASPRRGVRRIRSGGAPGDGTTMTVRLSVPSPSP